MMPLAANSLDMRDEFEDSSDILSIDSEFTESSYTEISQISSSTSDASLDYQSTHGFIQPLPLPSPHPPIISQVLYQPVLVPLWSPSLSALPAAPKYLPEQYIPEPPEPSLLKMPMSEYGKRLIDLCDGKPIPAISLSSDRRPKSQTTIDAAYSSTIN